MDWGLVLLFSLSHGRWLPEQDAELGNGAELSQGKINISSRQCVCSRVFLDAREGSPLPAVPLHGHVQLMCWAWSTSGQGCSGLQVVWEREMLSRRESWGSKVDTSTRYFCLERGWAEQDQTNEVTCPGFGVGTGQLLLA